MKNGKYDPKSEGAFVYLLAQIFAGIFFVLKYLVQKTFKVLFVSAKATCTAAKFSFKKTPGLVRFVGKIFACLAHLFKKFVPVKKTYPTPDIFKDCDNLALARQFNIAHLNSMKF